MTNSLPPPVLKVSNLNKLTLESANLRIEPGERIAIIGPSGAGKSVLLNCILGLISLQSGEIELLGKPIKGKPASMPGLGVAFQQPGLFDGRSITDNLRLASDNTLSSETTKQWLIQLGLASVSPEASPSILSGGQRKRIALARALLRGDRLLILDEPTSGLDPESIEQIIAVLQEALSDTSRSLLLITHNYAVALALCDRVLMLANGTLQEVTPDRTLNVEVAIEVLKSKLAHHRIENRRFVPAHKGPRWGFWPSMLAFLRQSLVISGLTMALLGTLLVAQSADLSFIDVSRYVPGVVVAGVFRELAPLVVGLLLASRIGAGVSSEVASMSYTAQLDSMRVLGISTTRNLLLPFASAAALAFPLNILLGAVAAVGVGGLIAPLPWSGLSIGTNRFYYLALENIEPVLILSCIIKGVCMGVGVVTVAYLYGARPIRSAPKLGKAVTLATVGSSIMVIVIDIIVSWFFFT